VKSFERKDFYTINSISLSKHLDKNNYRQIINTSVLFFAFSSIEALIGFLSKCVFQSFSCPYFALEKKITPMLQYGFPGNPSDG
jgi:hypothetical protein